jgi:hypothetical protein
MKRAPISGPFDLSVGDSSGDDVFRLWTLRALRNGKLDLLAFGKRLEALTLDCTEVCKNVGARFLLDEAEAFGFVEPFNGSTRNYGRDFCGNVEMECIINGALTS